MFSLSARIDAEREAAARRLRPPSLETIDLVPLPTLDYDYPPQFPDLARVERLSRNDAATVGPSTAVSDAQSAPSISSAPVASQNVGHSYEQRRQFVALCLCFLLAGWNDGAIGPLLPRIREVYQVSFLVVSLMFVCRSAGWGVGAVTCMLFSERIGLGKIMVLGGALQVVSLVVRIAAPPFPAFLATFFINALGESIQDTHVNSYVALWGDHTKMGISHAVYGFGAFASALVSTRFSVLDRWSLIFIPTVAIGIINIVSLLYIFRFKTKDECLAQTGREPVEKNPNGNVKMGQLVSYPAIPLLAIFLFIYTGLEVTMGSWISSYILEELHGSHTAGYVTAGFFAGLTVGRVSLLWINEKVGERRVIFIYIALALGLQLVVWLVPSRLGSGAAVALIGLLFGPLFPISMNVASRVLPRWILTTAIGWIAGIGQAGPAVLPFVTGALADKFGISSLQPLLVGMMATLAALWAIVPSRSRLD